MPIWDKPGTTREQLEYRPKLDTLRETQPSIPWYRRVWSWLSEAHKGVTILAAICAGTVGAHAYIAGLITKDNLKTEVKQAVTEAMLDTRARVQDLELHTSGIVEWRRDTDQKMITHDERIRANEKLAEKTEGRVDRYIARQR